MRNEKITSEHLKRKAVVYVRQSTADQVRFNRESQRRQYDLANRATEMGWKEVEVIDDDLGCSGSSAANRTGFQRLVASVCLKEVGAIFSLEASRLARNNRDWYQLVDLCGLVGTLIIDHDGVYDPRQMNDRLLLGLKGTMSEFELGLIRQRSLEALHAMAKRGELLSTVPVGYIRTRDNRCEKDPDLRIQHAVDLVFRKFSELGSVRQALLWFRQERVMIPTIEYDDSGRKVSWRLPLYGSLLKILTNPIYAGAYVYGRTTSRTTVVDGRPLITRGHRLEKANWEVLIKDHHQGYITWDEYERNQAQIKENAAMKGAMARGPARTGRSLLAGLMRCRRCGRKLRVTYSGCRGDVPRYSCVGANISYGEKHCLSFGGLAVDRAIEFEILKVIQPAAIEAAIGTAQALVSAHDERRVALELALEQAQYEADRARRQYDAVEPENRLVAAELERRWNEALSRVREVEKELEKLGLPPSMPATEEQRELLALAEDLPEVWNHPETDMKLKKRIARTLIEELVVDIDEDKSFIEVIIHWAGGCHSTVSVKRNRTGHHRYCTDQRVVDLVRKLAMVTSDQSIAAILNRLGYKTGKGQTWNQGRVVSLRASYNIPVYSPVKQENWLTLEQAASELQISPMSVHRLLKSGVLDGQQVVPCAPWIIPRDSLSKEAVQNAVRSIKAGRRRPLPEKSDQMKLNFEPISSGGALCH